MLEIRPIVVSEWNVWKAFRLFALQESPLAFGSTFAEEILFSDERWKQQLETMTIFGAFAESKLIGCAGFRVHEMLQMKHRGVFFGMYVHPDYRGRKVAHQLLDHLIAYAKTQVVQLHCGVKLINSSAIALYEKCGFVRYAIEPRTIKVGDIYYDDTWMVIFFDEKKNYERT